MVTTGGCYVPALNLQPTSLETGNELTKQYWSNRTRPLYRDNESDANSVTPLIPNNAAKSSVLPLCIPKVPSSKLGTRLAHQRWETPSRFSSAPDEKSRATPQTSAWPLPSTSLPSLYLPTIVSFDAIQQALQNASLQ